MKPNADRPGTEPDAKDDLKSLPIPELEKKLGSSPEGLSQAEAQKRLTQYGPNELEEEKTNAFLKFLSYFWGPIPWMIEVAVVLSAVAQHWPDFFIILVLLLANAVVGFWEEHQVVRSRNTMPAPSSSSTCQSLSRIGTGCDFGALASDSVTSTKSASPARSLKSFCHR